MNKPKVNFLCIGAQKAGTTSLPMYLRSNKELLTDDEYCNDVYMSNDELNFFSTEDVTEKSINNYEKKFDSNKNHTLIGEKTPGYCFPYAIDKIHKYNPNMKLIFLLREPISRCFSHLNMCVQLPELFHKTININSQEAIYNEIFEDKINCVRDITDISDDMYICRGFYDQCIQYIYTKFPKENLYIGISEEIKQNKDKEYKKIFDFLGCKYDKNIDINTWMLVDENSGKYEIEMPEKVRKDLYNLYKPHNENLYKILGRRIELWEKKYVDIINEQK